jgi:hypothetical protein
MTADPSNAITESNELNNSKSATVTVSGTVCGGSPCVDLVAGMTGPPIVSSGGVGFYTATITNAGTTQVADSPAWNVHISLTGPGVIQTVIPLGAGVTCTTNPLFADCSGTTGSPDAMDLGPGASVQFQVTAQDLGPSGSSLLLQTDADLPAPGVVPELIEATNNTAIVATATGP